MIYAMSSKIIFNEGRQAREEPNVLSCQLISQLTGAEHEYVV
jgi:hypothetical protein